MASFVPNRLVGMIQLIPSDAALQLTAATCAKLTALCNISLFRSTAMSIHEKLIRTTIKLSYFGCFFFVL